MAETDAKTEEAAKLAAEEQSAADKGGAYDVLRARLTEQCKDLRQRVDKLNLRRKEVFGGMETALAGSSRIQTEHNCLPRDIIQLGKKLILGYDVFLGLKKETEVSDVLAVYEFDGEEFKPLGLDFLADETFVRDFKELYRYFKNARLLQLRNTGTHLLFVFQTGASHTDYKVFKWVLNPDGTATYEDNRGKHTYPEQFDFQWKRTSREQHIQGKHPHISIDDMVYVECVGGDLTIKVEDNTDSGHGIFAEPVDDVNQSLGDAVIDYAILGNLVLMRITPFGEQERRHIVFSRLTQTARRVDNIRQACVQLPEGHGIIFPGGYFLQTGECKEFGEDIRDMEFFKTIRSTNGEDVIFMFHHRVDGRYIILQYNLIEKEVATPILCNGYSLFEDGKLVIFKRLTNDPSKSHAVQIWQTPFVGENFQPEQKADSFLSRVGNKDLVRGISDALTVTKLARESTASTAAYLDLVKHTERVLDQYHWLNNEECFGLDAVLKSVKDTGNTIIDEFEKVQSIKKTTQERVNKFSEDVDEHFRQLRQKTLESIDQYASSLAKLRDMRGGLITLRELRYVDMPRLDKLEKKIVDKYDELSEKTVEFLLQEGALAPYTSRLDEMLEQVETVTKVTEATPIQDDLKELSSGLDLLSEIINNLKIEDSTARTEIIESLSVVYSHLNRTRAQLEARRKDLLGHELIAEFGAQFKLLSQAVSNYIGLSDSPEKCDEFLTKLLVQVEELEAKFSEFPEYIEKISDKRDEIYDAFSGKKQMLLDERQRKANAMADAAGRILKGVVRRAQTFKTPEELNAYFASDPMVLKIRDFIEKLEELGDSVKADDLLSKIKVARQDAGRSLKDKQEIFEDGDNIIKFGQKRFSVNTQPLDLSLVMRDDRMHFHLTGTDFYQPVDDEHFTSTREFWDQDLPSENARVYRAEYLAYKMLVDAEAEQNGLNLEDLQLAEAADELPKIIREYTSALYDEGYERGVHDHDAAKILSLALRIRAQAGLLRYDPTQRAFAGIYWGWLGDEKQRALIERKARSLGRMRLVFGGDGGSQTFIEQIANQMAIFFKAAKVDAEGINFTTAAEYLFNEVSQEHAAGFVTSKEAADLLKEFNSFLAEKHAQRTFEGDLDALKLDLLNSWDLARTWLHAFMSEREDEGDKGSGHFIPEVLGLLLTRNRLKRATVQAPTTGKVESLLGQHRLIAGGTLPLRFDEFLKRVGAFARDDVPRYREYQQLRKEIAQKERERLRLDEFMPKTLSSFVRNKLINEVYLPVIGENLAKQMGEAGESKRTDLMGLLLLISPPGYGKTTLMEYIANRMGLVFMKINGPALGNEVHSLDPTAAPNATAREEVEKLNLAFEMGNNVMIYLDDIQHVDPEFLQKFISLCDAQRKIEGVYKGKTKTYDLRGKKVCIVMAGNPYTESGARFQIPDMLSNRADTYNLGDILGGREDYFELSYLENCLTSNAILNPLSTRPQEDFYKLVRMADGEEVGETDLSHDYSAAELNDIVEVIRKLRKIQRVVLRVNKEYIHSAAQSDEYRTEPPFKLQGSYRDMNKLAAKVLPVLTEKELENLIQDHYNSESQTLTSGAEMNMLKLAEIRGLQNEQEKERWEDIKRTFGRRQMMFGDDSDDKVSLVVAQLANFNENLDRIQGVIKNASEKEDEKLGDKLESAITRLGSTFSEAADSRNEQLGGQLESALVKMGERLGEISAQQASKGNAKGSQQALEQALVKAAESFQVTAQDRDEILGEKLAGAITQLGQAIVAGGERKEPKVEIVNTLPKYYGNLYKHHIDVIEGVLVPMVKGLNEQIKNTDNVHALLMRVTERLNALSGRHEELQKRNTAKKPEKSGKPKK